MGWKVGFEIELLAPRGQSRLDLAERLARTLGGTVRRELHQDSEPSKVPGMKVFWHLTPAFDVLDRRGRRVVRLVDDITLQQDLDRTSAPAPGWYRVVSDDVRLLGLAARHAAPNAPIAESLRPLGELFGTAPERLPNGMFRLTDSKGASVAMACPLPGERERSCELISSPIEAEHGGYLDWLLGNAREAGFLIPREGALHLHFDGAPLRSAAVVKNLVALLHPHRALLSAMVGTNPECRRLGPWPDALLKAVKQRGFAALEWEQARARILAAGVQKYCDFNLYNFVRDLRGKSTLEVRILPVHLTVEPILDAARLFEAVLRRAAEPVAFRPVAKATRQAAERFFRELKLAPEVAHRYLAALERRPGEAASG